MKCIVSIYFRDETKERIVNYEKADIFMRDNEFIIRGYRINFNSGRKILKSLFILHNESVNVWTHLIATILFISLFFYTAIFISRHWTVVDDLQSKLDYVRNEIISLKIPISENIPSFENMTEKIEKSKEFINDFIYLVSNSTIEYFNNFDEKLGEYRDYISSKINCLECLKDIYLSVRNFSEKFIKIDISLIKDTLINETKQVINTFNVSHLENFLNETNKQLLKFRDEIIDNLESKEMEWIDIYTSRNEKNTDVKKWPLFVFLFGAVSCLSMSAYFHLFWVQSKEISEILARLDYAGISLLIAGSCFPLYYYSFFCDHCKIYFNI